MNPETELLIFDQLPFRLEDTVCGSLIILQIHLRLRILDAERLRHLISLPCLRIYHLILHHKRDHITPDIREPELLFRHLCHRHLSPDHRAGIRMDIYISQIISIRAAIRLQLSQKLMVCIFLKCRLMKLSRKFHAFFHMVFSQITDLGIKIYLSVLLRLRLQKQQVLLPALHQILKIQFHTHVSAVILQRHMLSVLDQPAHIQTSDLIGKPFDMRIVFLNRDD